MILRASLLFVVSLAGPGAAPGSAQTGPTFAADVAPIVFDACAPCHRPGGPGPFSLTSYIEVRQRATQVVQVTRSRYMPPWKVDPVIGHFQGQRLLTDRELEVLEAWAKAGTPEGNPADMPRLPAFADGWLLGTPDLIVTLPSPFVLQAEPTDSFRIFAIPIPVAARTYVRGIEFHPGRSLKPRPHNRSRRAAPPPGPAGTAGGWLMELPSPLRGGAGGGGPSAITAPPPPSIPPLKGEGGKASSPSGPLAETLAQPGVFHYSHRP